MNLLPFDIIKGLDADYVLYGGELVRIIKIEFSNNWLFTTSGWEKIYLENNICLQIGEQKSN